MPVVAKWSPISATAELLLKKDLTSAHLLLFIVCYSGMASLVIWWKVTQVFHIIVHSVMELVWDLTNCQLNVSCNLCQLLLSQLFKLFAVVFLLSLICL